MQTLTPTPCTHTQHAAQPAGSSPLGTSPRSAAAASPELGRIGSPTPSPARKAAGVAGKIAAFSSGVAPISSGGAGGDGEQEVGHTVSEVLHQLEAACRVRLGSGGPLSWGLGTSAVLCGSAPLCWLSG